MDGEVHEVTKSWTRLSDFTSPLMEKDKRLIELPDLIGETEDCGVNWVLF